MAAWIVDQHFGNELWRVRFSRDRGIESRRQACELLSQHRRRRHIAISPNGSRPYSSGGHWLFWRSRFGWTILNGQAARNAEHLVDSARHRNQVVARSETRKRRRAAWQQSK